MSRTRYRIDLAHDQPERLRDVIELLGEERRRIVNVIWQPARTVKGEDGTAYEVNSGYVVISEAEFR